ncbi:hypothetical protein [Rhizomonospora bruguierae]|uniref:hypothetical protein n=1 Tax=Rhizomonospora bruguierae TaxID=1581705 RepID=UPI001BCB02F8|nr:hypothetical protein [Micromonospora sp. NBRC 107566]
MSKLIPGPPRAGHIWLDALVAAAVFFWLAALVLLAMTWMLHSRDLAVGAVSAVVAAGALSVVSCMLGAITAMHRRVATGQRATLARLEGQVAEHREALEAHVDEQLAAVLAELQKLHNRNTDELRRLSRVVARIADQMPQALKAAHWEGYADGVEDTGGDSNVRRLTRRREEGAVPGSGRYGS